jgi:hypothetical protein
MLTAFIVIREEKHIDPKYWVCLVRRDALKIARDVTDYWIDHYQPEPEYVDTKLYADQIFNYNCDGAFHVSVESLEIREAGETEPD